MSASTSRIVVGTPRDLEVGRTFFAFGDRDDPARLVVLIAAHLARSGSGEASRIASRCLQPRTPWQERLALLRSALRETAFHSAGHFAALWDVDALVASDTETWEDDRSEWMRRGLFKVLIDSAADGGWILVRTRPSRRGTAELEDLDVHVTDAQANDVTLIDEEKVFSPECRPIAAWLIQIGALERRDLGNIIRTVKRFDDHIVQIAFDALPSRTRDAAKLLTALRAPLHVNGCVGPLALSGDRVSARSLPRSAVEDLTACGFLQPSVERRTERLPRTVRVTIARFSNLGMATEIQALHTWLAGEPVDLKPIEDQLEAHFHAICAGDLELAKRTATYYGTELRELAAQLSREADVERNPGKFERAAALFEYIVDRFDETDAYSWEYLGYNLARVDAMRFADRILDAYQRAHQRWHGNPLYHGRLLGFRGQLGQEVVQETIHGIDQYVQEHGAERDAVSFFAEAVIRGLLRGSQRDQVTRIAQARRVVLEQFAPRAIQRAAG